jgi:hypothetical protein
MPEDTREATSRRDLVARISQAGNLLDLLDLLDNSRSPAALTQKFETSHKAPLSERPPFEFIIAINAILVGLNCRSAALPPTYCDRELVPHIITCFNRCVPLLSVKASEVGLLKFRLRNTEGEIMEEALIIREAERRSFDTREEWSDEKLGGHLGMDPFNTRNFRPDLPFQCDILEPHTKSSIFHEFVAEWDQFDSYCSTCRAEVAKWNAKMGDLGLKYRFECTIGKRQDYKRQSHLNE